MKCKYSDGLVIIVLGLVAFAVGCYVQKCGPASDLRYRNVRFDQVRGHLQTLSVCVQRLGVSFTETQYESEFSQKTQELVKSLQEKGLLKLE